MLIDRSVMGMMVSMLVCCLPCLAMKGRLIWLLNAMTVLNSAVGGTKTHTTSKILFDEFLESEIWTMPRDDMPVTIFGNLAE